PRAAATGGRYRKTASIAASQSTAITTNGLDNQPSCPGRRVALRHAKALAICPATTAANAAPDAGRSAAPDGNGDPGVHPAAESAVRNATISTTASVSPRTM